MRTYWYLDGFHAIASLSLASLLVQLLVLALESCSKRRWLIEAGSGGGGGGTPEECASFVSRSLFGWVNGLFAKGYRRQLLDSDLRIIDSSLSAAGIEPEFEKLMGTKKCVVLKIFLLLLLGLL